MPNVVSNQSFPFDSVELVDRPWFPYLCTEVENWQWKTAGDGHYNLWVALSGDGYLTCDGETFRIKPGMFFIFSPQQNVSAAHYSGPRITRFSAHFHPLSQGERVASLGQASPMLGYEAQSLEALRRRVDALMRIAMRREDDATLSEHLYQLIREVCSGVDLAEQVMVHPRVAEAIRVFRESPSSVDSIDVLAKQLGISRSHFDREFSNQVGQAPKQFLINCKLIEAKRYLESSQLRVGEIAEALGYKDIYFFSRQFKQFCGMSPLQYRQSFTPQAQAVEQ
ncbi:MAG: helix-turn-helix domain-containing protein [Opitutaceae bacterium]